MDSNETISGGGGGTDLSSAASAQPGSAATALFPYAEVDLVDRLGRPADKIAAARKDLHQGTDWSRVARQFRWSEQGVKNLAAALGCPAIAADVKTAAPTPLTEKSAPVASVVSPGTVRRMVVSNLNIPNQRLVLCKDEKGAGASVQINPEWRPLFRLGMWIEATAGAAGVWRTRRPRSVGRF